MTSFDPGPPDNSNSAYQPRSGQPDQPGQTPRLNPRINPLAIRSLILGLLALIGLGLLAGIPAIIVGRKSIRQINERGQEGRELAAAGCVMGAI
jgi:Domain of unknown function (DUF4190)